MNDFLLDSNILIYASKPEFDWLITDYINEFNSVSLITKIEVLGYPHFTPPVLALTQAFFEDMTVFDISHPIADLAIYLRQHKKMSLGDSIIGATALLENKTLITRNTSDFDWITGLTVINPIDK